MAARVVSNSSPIIALAAFMLGALAAGRVMRGMASGWDVRATALLAFVGVAITAASVAMLATNDSRPDLLLQTVTGVLGFAMGMQALRVGDPIDPTTQLGPLASVRLASELEAQVATSVQMGARLVCGGRRDDPDSAFFPATVLTDIPIGAPAYGEELFGPVGCVFVAVDAGDAIRIANDTRFGLAASVWSNDAVEQERFVREIDAGSVFVNDMVVSDPRFPFGGVKSSGYGRELSDIGLREFTNIKTVRIRRALGAHAGTTE